MQKQYDLIIPQILKETEKLTVDCIIPSDYWVASPVLSKYIQNRRANTLTEAINLFESEMQNNMLYKSHQELLELQRMNQKILNQTKEMVSDIRMWS